MGFRYQECCLFSRKCQVQKMKFFERLPTLNKSLIFGGYTLGKIKGNICLKIRQNPCSKHHQIDQKTSIFHTF